MKYVGSKIESYLPSEDARATDTLRVLDGKNFGWDSKGPKSAYASRMQTPIPFVNPRDVQGLRAGAFTFVFTAQQILTWDTLNNCWAVLYTFDTTIPAPKRSPWAAVFISNTIILTQKYRGTFTAKVDTFGSLRVKKETSATIIGLISNAQAAAIVRGRVILANDTTIQWGNVGNVTDFTPALGGPGIQAINQIATGTFIALTTAQDSFIVWTSTGAISAEYIGGDQVWRFDSFESKDRPISERAVVPVLTGGSIFLSAQGLQSQSGSGQTQAITADFNEFLRDYIENSMDTVREWRLEYDYARQAIYLLESTDGYTYPRAFVVYPTLNKWGMFNHRCWGILPITNDRYGYVSQLGHVRFFYPGYNREGTPAVDGSYMIRHPYIERLSQEGFAVDLGRSNTYNPTTAPAHPPATQRVGWYTVDSDRPQSGPNLGMDAWIDIGYFRPPGQMPTPNAGIEIQNISIGSIPSMARAEFDAAVLNHDSDWFVYVSHDLNNGGVDGDSNTGTVDQDLNVDSAGDTWALKDLPLVNMAVSLKPSNDGITFDVPAISLSAFYTGLWYYTVQSDKVFNTLRVTADSIDGYFAIRYLEVNEVYGGDVK